MSVPIPLDTLLALNAQGGGLGPVGLTAAHCHFTQRVVVLEFIEGKPDNLRWTEPMPAEEAEVLLAKITAIAKRLGLDERAGPSRH